MIDENLLLGYLAKSFFDSRYRLNTSLKKLEVAIIKEAVERTGNRSRAAKHLGITRNTVTRRIGVKPVETVKYVPTLCPQKRKGPLLHQLKSKCYPALNVVVVERDFL